MVNNDNECDWVGIEIARGCDLDAARRTEWYVLGKYKDGGEEVVSDHLSHASAIIAAMEHGLPVRDFPQWLVKP